MYDDTTLDVALNQFQANKSHISLVQHIVNTDPDRDPYPVTTGVVTMEVRACARFLFFSSLFAFILANSVLVVAQTLCLILSPSPFDI
jgi:hypothetical protein